MTNRVVFCPKDKQIQELDLNSFSNLKINDGVELNKTNQRIKVMNKLCKQYKLFDDAFKVIETQLNSLALIEKNKDQIYNILKTLIDDFAVLLNVAVSESQIHGKCADVLKEKVVTVKKYVQSSIKRSSTSYKREQNRKKCANYVEPLEMAIGLKWHTKINVANHLPDHTIKQLTFQYVPILKTLKCLFAQPDFKNEYLKFNLSNDHTCKDGVYEHFCCSKTYKKCKLFEDKMTIKIRLAVDDCDVCDPVKSKSVIHKLNCVYFTVDNMPEKYLSKTDNLFLVSLCESTNLKEDDNTFDQIGRIILNELKELESVGI